MLKQPQDYLLHTKTIGGSFRLPIIHKLPLIILTYILIKAKLPRIAIWCTVSGAKRRGGGGGAQL
jgi:hypothetical protein